MGNWEKQKPLNFIISEKSKFHLLQSLLVKTLAILGFFPLYVFTIIKLHNPPNFLGNFQAQTRYTH